MPACAGMTHTMQYQLSCPSKTFLLGEYFILDAGSAIIINTEPRFSLTATEHNQDFCSNIENNSPTGQFLKTYQPDFAGLNIQFNDPHHGAGGLGASTAQFLLCYALQQQLKHQPFILETSSQIQELLDIYRRFAWSGNGTPPSGADLLAQYTGQLTLYDKTAATLHSMVWPFSDLALCLIRTGKKLATHEHLSTLPSLNTSALAKAMNMANAAMTDADSEHFITAMNDYGKALSQLNLVADHSIELLNQLPKQYVLAAKGCGGMGADIIAVIIATEKLANFTEWAEQKQLAIVATHQQISAGLAHCV